MSVKASVASSRGEAQSDEIWLASDDKISRICSSGTVKGSGLTSGVEDCLIGGMGTGQGCGEALVRREGNASQL